MNDYKNRSNEQKPQKKFSSKPDAHAFQAKPMPGKPDAHAFQAKVMPGKPEVPAFQEKVMPPQRRNIIEAVMNKEEATPSDDHLEGKNPILEAFRANRTINKIWLAPNDGKRADPIISRIMTMAKEAGVPILEVPRTTLDRMSETRNHQGIIAQTASHEYVEIDDMLRIAEEKNEPPFLLMLDELKDAYNLGSVLRIADAAGVHGVIIPKHRSIGLDSVVAKASSGAIEYVPVARVVNLSRTIKDLKDKGFWVFGTDAEAPMSYDRADFRGPLLLVIGSEGEGISRMIRENCDVLVSIPMSGKVNSLNAAVAAGVVVYEARKQRTQIIKSE